VTYDVVIVGAGVGGSALALGLARHRLRILLLEQHAGPGNLNRGDSLLPKVTAQLAGWGVLDRLRAAGARELCRMEVFDRGVRLMEAPLFRPGQDHPYLVLAHPEIERVLVAAACDSGQVEAHYRCRALELIEQQTRICGLRVNDQGQQRTVHARLVVGADGARSVVRSGLDISVQPRPYDHSYFGIEIERPAGYRDAMRIELSRRGGVLVVPTRDPERVGLGVLVHAADEPLFRSGSLEQKIAAISQRAPLFADCRPAPCASHLYRLCRAHASRYVGPGAALLGDAIHVTNPTAGQGMTMAIEDAAALARQIGPQLAAGASDAALDRALLAYQAERRPRNAAMIRWSHWISRVYARQGRSGQTLRKLIFGFAGSTYGRRLHTTVWSRLAAA